MKRSRKTVALVCAVVMMFVFAGCGDSGKLADSKYCGTWVASTAEYSGFQLSAESVFGGKITLTLDPDGKCTFDAAGDEQKGKWSESEDGKLLLDGYADDDVTVSLGASEDELLIQYQGISMTFKKQK